MIEDDEILRYDRMVETALRGVVKSSIRQVIKHGLPGDHHFYITFMTTHEGVDIPEYLMERYPGEMTIVLQYQFTDLEVDDEFLKVTLSFNSVPERLVIPLNAISIFADPSVNFALQFQPMEEELSEEDLAMFDDEGPDDDGSGGGGSKGDKTGEVVSLDKFRKK
ncbi:MAG: SspB family protein [Alphaproteobacteria bacterium]